MRLTSDVRESFRVGKFEEFIDRAEDHLKRRFLGKLPGLEAVPDDDWRDLVRSSFDAAKRLGKPSERLTVMIATARIPLGSGVFSDHRFYRLKAEVVSCSRRPGIGTDPVEAFLETAEPFWTQDRYASAAGQFRDLLLRFEEDGSLTALRECLGAREQTGGHYAARDVAEQMRVNHQRAESMGVSDPGDIFRFLVLADCYGNLFYDDPFRPSLRGCLETRDGIERAFTAMATKEVAP